MSHRSSVIVPSGSIDVDVNVTLRATAASPAEVKGCRRGLRVDVSDLAYADPVLDARIGRVDELQLEVLVRLEAGSPVTFTSRPRWIAGGEVEGPGRRACIRSLRSSRCLLCIEADLDGIPVAPFSDNVN